MRVTALILSLVPAAARAQEVFLGSADQWGDLVQHSEQWPFVRDNVDGLYVNFIMMHRLRGDLLNATARLLKNRKAFLESDNRTPKDGDDGSGAAPEDDQSSIQRLHASGLTIPYTSLNYGWSQERAVNLRGFDKRPGAARRNFVQIGPWNIGGDIAQDREQDPARVGLSNAAFRDWIKSSDGASTDGPMGLWKADNGKMRAASVSIVRFAHRHGKLAVVMLGPYGANNPDYDPAQFLSVSQDAVRLHEDAAAVPDIWTVFEYATSIPAVPEQDGGRAAATTTGAAFWLLHHLRDPDHAMSMAVSPIPAPPVAGPQDGRPAREACGRAVEIVLANQSDWLDFAPRLRLDGPGGGQRMRVTIDGADVSEAIRTGVPLAGPLRLWPGQRRTIRLSVGPGGRIGTEAMRLELYPGIGSAVPSQALALQPAAGKCDGVVSPPNARSPRPAQAPRPASHLGWPKAA